jgi:tetratricopeptide (TPR) repeat protein
VAELLEAGGDALGAAAAYQEVAEEYRRRGRPDEVGRIAEMALRLKPDDLPLLLDAAGARVEAGEHKRALAHLQLAFGQAPRDPQTLDLLSRAFEGVGQADKALKVLGELARVAAERGQPALEAEALRRSLRLAPGEADLLARLRVAEEKITRMERRLTQLALAEPTTEAELRAQVRAEVYLRYGFADRADGALTEALAHAPDALGLLAAKAEVEATRDAAAALVTMERILLRAGAEADAVRERIALVRLAAGLEPATSPSASPPAAPASPGSASRVASASADAYSPEAKGDRLAAAGDLVGAVMAYREALATNPLDDTVLGKIAALRSAPRAAAVVAPPEPSEEDAFADFGPLEDGTFAEVLPDALDEVSPLGDVDEARSLVAVGMWTDALAMLEELEGLEAAVLRSQAVRGLGEVSRALDLLREASNDAAETDPAYPEALFELSALYTATGKHRAAVRLLEELRDLDPGYRVGEVEARMRGLQKLLK